MKYLFKITGKVPSKKNSYRVTKTGGFYKDAKIQDFITGAGWEITPQLRKHGIKNPLTGDLRMDITFYTDARSDVDNMVTTIFDLLQELGVIENDRQVMELHAYKIKSKEIQTNIDIETNE